MKPPGVSGITGNNGNLGNFVTLRNTDNSSSLPSTSLRTAPDLAVPRNQPDFTPHILVIEPTQSTDLILNY